MADSLPAQRDFALHQLDDLMRRGRELRDALAANASDAPSLAAARSWQQTCATAIHQLSGGSKAHWLSRAFSGALLVRSAEGGAVVEANVGEIVGRMLDVLEQAGASLGSIDDVTAASSTAPPATRRFEFVHSPQLRPILEEAFVESGRALAKGDFTLSLMTSCGILEAIITDALEHCGSRMAECGVPAECGLIADWSFERRIAVAENLRSSGHIVRAVSLRGALQPDALADVNVVVHLAGEPVAQRWTAAARDRILRSRVEGTRALVAAMRGQPPQVIGNVLGGDLQREAKDDQAGGDANQQ